MSEERLELVTDFSSLRAGMLVVWKNCLGCDGQHRAVLVKCRLGRGGYLEGRPVWEHAPVPACGRCLTVERAVAERRLFRVIDEQLDAETLTTRKAELVEELVQRSARGLHPLGAWRR